MFQSHRAVEFDCFVVGCVASYHSSTDLRHTANLRETTSEKMLTAEGIIILNQRFTMNLELDD